MSFAAVLIDALKVYHSDVGLVGSDLNPIHRSFGQIRLL